MTTIALDPVSKARVMYDILNEPDCRGIGWEGGGSGRSMVRRLLPVFTACLHFHCPAPLPADTMCPHQRDQPVPLCSSLMEQTRGASQ